MTGLFYFCPVQYLICFICPAIRSHHYSHAALAAELLRILHGPAWARRQTHHVTYYPNSNQQYSAYKKVSDSVTSPLFSKFSIKPPFTHSTGSRAIMNPSCVRLGHSSLFLRVTKYKKFFIYSAGRTAHSSPRKPLPLLEVPFNFHHRLTACPSYSKRTLFNSALIVIVIFVNMQAKRNFALTSYKIVIVIFVNMQASVCLHVNISKVEKINT